MIQVYADNTLVYDSRREDLDLIGLEVTNGLNVGGTAEITLPPLHPAYNAFVWHKTLVRIYRDGKLRFRGRALHPMDDFTGQRTVTCEGELCFLRDTVNRPYKYPSPLTPRSIFVTIINAHNAQTDHDKQFVVGDVTVVDEWVGKMLESDSPETTLDTMTKLVERFGGYLVFSDADDGRRVINWVRDLDTQSRQVIEFGENLLDFASSGESNDALATIVVPYGAKDEKTKHRITIESVNGGKDYITDEDAVLVRGRIITPQTWDDITDPSELLKTAQAYLAKSKLFVTTLELTALDLSYLGLNIDTFNVGDWIRAVSAPHGVDDYFQLTQMTEDLLNPANCHITLGKDVLSLTGATVATDRRGQTALSSVRVQVDNGQDLSGFVTTDDLDGYVNKDDLGIYAQKEDLAGYATKAELAGYATKAELVGYATDEDVESLSTRLQNEVVTRAGILNRVDGTVHFGGGAPININGSKIDVIGTEINFHKEIRFGNESGVRIADTEGNYYYIVRVDYQNNTHIGTDTNNLYLRGPVVYLKASNAVVTSDRRAKDSIEELPEAYVDMLDKLTPMRFKYKDGTSDRYHVGFIAQDVEQALTDSGLTTQDFAGFVDLDKDGKTLGLAYDEFIGLLFQKIRKLERKIEAMEEKQ